MAEEPERLAVVLTDEVIDQLHEIWVWNAKRYSPDHATSYVDFLEQALAALGTEYQNAKPVATRPDLSHIKIRWRPGAAAHIAVFSIDEATVTVADLFHESQDWENKLID